MDARPLRLALVLGASLFSAPLAFAAEHSTANFVAHAPTPELAKECAWTAEKWRDRLALEWLGKKLPKWSRPCPIEVKVGQIGAGGATTFTFNGGEVYGWRMNVQGTRERILDSVIPHEVSHTIFASYFRRPLPRWADEGAATLAEHESEQRRQDLHLKQVWSSSKIPLQSLLSMKEYPTDMQDVMTLYAQGYSLADYLVQKRGRAKYLEFLDDAEKESWEISLHRHYGIEGVDALEGQWGNWVIAGSPDIPADGTLVASNDRNPAAEDPTIRAQNPEVDEEPFGPPAPPAPPIQPIAAAEVEDAGLTGFLPPQASGVRTASASPVDEPDDKEPRPAPLNAFRGREASRAGVATETAAERPSDDRRPLPRATRVEPAASTRGLDFFDPTSEAISGSKRTLGAPAAPR